MPVKTLHVTHPTLKQVKFGRRQPVAHTPRLRLADYLKFSLPQPPASCDYTAKAAAVLADILLNDSLGDCVIAGGYHIVGVETGNAGTAFHATDAQITKDYSAIGGYVPGDESTDEGCDETTALDYWAQHGFANGTKILGSLVVDATNKAEVQVAMFLFENLMFGVGLPDAWISPFPSASGFTWDVNGDADPSNGHCVVGVGYNSSGVQIDSWGMIGTMTYAAVAAYAGSKGGGELHVALSPDQLAKGMTKAPNGVDWAQLIVDFNSMGGKVPVPSPSPAPTPPAPPAPSPTPPPLPPAPAVGVTLAQAQAWAKAAIEKSGPKSGQITRSRASTLAETGLANGWPKS